MSEEDLQKAEKRRVVKGERERYIHLNAKIQKIARRAKKAFLVINTNKQRKTIECERQEISKKIRETKRTFYASPVQLLSCGDSLQLHGLQHTRPPCPSPTPGVYSDSCPLSQ